MAGATTQPAGLNGEGSGPRAASVILNVIDVLRCFTVEEPLQGVTEIATRVGLHKSSVSRILATLEREAIVERDDASRKYRLGLGLIAVAGPLLANLDVRRVSLPMLRDLSAETGETIALVVWDGSEAVTVEQVPSAQNIKHTTPLGTRYTSALNASVQVFLAELSADRARELINGGVAAPPAESRVSVEELLSRLSRTRERGFAVNYGDTYPEEVGISAPVRDHRGETVAGVLLAAPLYRVKRERVEELGRSCASTAAQISARLGAPPT
ncbi:IclR family transcriptional regulator [Georgenia sp. AZ-5]|uniref:IclR family transcriptional regulator n=1 Tax=Georgenia sp. AZ-5 TaxID=3367526 RepID=UPI00375450BA